MKPPKSFGPGILGLGFALLISFSASAQQQMDFAAPQLPASLYQYADIELPAHFTNGTGNNGSVTALDNTPADNPITNAGATLGRVLFYDKRLSANDSVACASCHQQAHGFSDPEVLSTGFDGGLTGRHSMGLSNARFYARGHFFWDERAATLEEQVLMPIQDPVEMNQDLDELISELEQAGFYQNLFETAFGNESITTDRISRALSQFVRSLLSYQSKFDLAMANRNIGAPGLRGTLNEQELLGHSLFSATQNPNVDSLGCGGCHSTAAQLSNNIENNGLDQNTDADQGAGDGRFKAPSLRDIANRPPYMHDGRFQTLEEVVEFYNSGIQDHPQLSPRLREGGNPQGAPVRFNMSDEEKAGLVAFLKTLTDPFLLNDIRFSDPFSEPVASLDVFSGSWYDPAHDGEGWMVEVLDDEQAVIYWFSYDQNGKQVWMLGVAERDGNNLTADMNMTSGPKFGESFDPADAVQEPWGTISLQINGCDSAVLDYASVKPEFGSGRLQPERLVSLDGLDCQQPSKPASSAFSAWSGSWYDPLHDGEGWIIEVMDDTSALVYWFTYDQHGEQIWMLGVAGLNGNSLKADMQMASGPGFGAGFDPTDVVLYDWGSLEITFDGCNSASISYSSAADGYGTGNLQPGRLTSLAGLSCE